MLSARTTALKRVVRPSRVACPPRSRTLTHPSQLSVRLSGSNGNGLGAAEGGRGGAFDADVDELARLRVAGEVHCRVPASAAAQQGRIGAARPFDEHLLHAADAGRVPLEPDALAELDQP